MHAASEEGKLEPERKLEFLFKLLGRYEEFRLKPYILTWIKPERDRDHYV